MHAQSLQSCSIICNPMGCSPPGSSVHGILQARILEWVVTASSRRCSRPVDWTAYFVSSVLKAEFLLLSRWQSSSRVLENFKTHFLKQIYVVFRNVYTTSEELDNKESWVLKNWWFWIVMLEKAIESSLDCKEIQPVNTKVNQSWIFIGRTEAGAEALILWPHDAKRWFIRKDPDAREHWRQEEKQMTEDRMVGWHHWLNGLKFE